MTDDDEGLTTFEILDNLGSETVQRWIHERKIVLSQRAYDLDEMGRELARRKAKRDADAVELAASGITPGATWEPQSVDDVVAAFKNGTLEETRPTVGLLDQGEALFYREAVNGIHGASGSGKSWTGLAVCAQELRAGRVAIYIDYEDTRTRITERLLRMGVPGELLLTGPNQLFYYLHPGEPWNMAYLRGLIAMTPSVVVVDSTGEAMSTDGVSPNADEEVARWFKGCPAAFAKAGAAVILLDHMAKADETGLWPIGSQRKRAAITGAQYLQTTKVAFDKDTPGSAELRCAKDRHGNYRSGLLVGSLVVMPGEGATEIELRASQWIDETPSEKLGRMMERVSHYIESVFDKEPDHPGPGVNMVTKNVKGDDRLIRQALDQLIKDGFIRWEPGKRQVHYHHIVTPYRHLPELEAGVDEDD